MFFNNNNNNSDNPYRGRNIGGQNGGSEYRKARSYIGKHEMHLSLPIELVEQIDAFASYPQIGTRTNAIIQLSQIALFVIQKRGKLENPEIRDQLEAQFEQGTIVDWMRTLSRSQFKALDAIFQTEYEDRMKAVDEERRKRAMDAGSGIEGTTKRWIEYKQEEEYSSKQQSEQQQSTSSSHHHNYDNDDTNSSGQQQQR
jgi:hypothetical protein